MSKFRKQFSSLRAFAKTWHNHGPKPKAPFKIENEVEVLEWCVQESFGLEDYCSFTGTIITYEGKRWRINNPNPSYLIGTRIRGKERTKLPIGYDALVEAYHRAKG